MPRVIVFAVNETLLDLRALDPAFERLFGDAAARQAWFAQLLQSALASTVTDAYADFGTIGGAALEMVAARRGVSLAADEKGQILGGIRTLPPYPEVRQSLEHLRAAGLRLAALTNSTAAVAGLRDLFEQTLSADAVRRLKPAPEPYRMAAASLGVAVGEVRLVAAHSWDVAGALRAGAAAAFIARPAPGCGS